MVWETCSTFYLSVPILQAPFGFLGKLPYQSFYENAHQLPVLIMHTGC